MVKGCIIPKVKSASGKILSSPKEIDSRFQHFYESQYASHSTAESSSVHEFLNQCNLPSLYDTPHIGRMYQIYQNSSFQIQPYHRQINRWGYLLKCTKNLTYDNFY